MKSKRPLALIALGSTLAAFFTCLIFTRGQLPARIATHFNAAGIPDAWSDRGSFATSFAGFVVLLNLLIIGPLALVRFFPNSALNLPHRDHWLAPERRRETFSALLTWGLFLASSLTLLQTGLYLLIVRANQHSPAQLEDAWPLTAAFIAPLIFQIILLWRRFSKPSAPDHEKTPPESSSGVPSI